MKRDDVLLARASCVPDTAGMKEASFELIRTLSEAYGPSGSEEAVRMRVKRAWSDFELTSDRSGSLLARKPNGVKQPRVVLTAHMDEIGLMVQSVTETGYLRIVPLGGWWTHALVAHRVRVLTRSGEPVPGVVASTPPHFLKPEQRKQVMDMADLYIDVGASSRSEVMVDLGIRVGDSVVPEAVFTRLARKDRFLGKALDNRLGLALLVQALPQLVEGDLPCDLMGVATVQEELGLRGARTAAHVAQPDVVIVLEGPPADDTPGLPQAECQGRLGGGVQIRVMDPSAVMNRRLVDYTLDVAEACRIPHQVTVRRSGGTDAGAFHLAGPGAPCVVLGVPARYIHTHHAIADINDYLAALRLVRELVPRLDYETVKGFTKFV